MFNRSILVRALLFLACVSTFGTSLAEVKVDMKSTKWRLTGEDAKLVELDGRRAIRLKNGMAMLEGVTLENGRIEFEVYTSGLRSFAYLLFRGQTKDEYEDFYIRPHKSDLPDALQYAPVFQQQAAWQLYHGPQGTAAASLPAKEWIPIRVELTGPRAAFWIGNATKPAMVIDRLGRKPTPGWLAFRGFVPKGSNAPYAAYFANVRITRYDLTSKEQAKTTSALPPGQLSQWLVSPVFSSEPGPILTLPAGLRDGPWNTLPIRPNGVLEFLRSRSIPEKSKHWAVAADIRLHAENAQVCQVALGYSDEITLSVNGTALFYQNQSFSPDKPRRQGLMHPDQLVAYLPLQQGNNVIRAVIGDRFGGWGLSARMIDCNGVVEINTPTQSPR